MNTLKLRDFKDKGFSVTKTAVTSRFEADTYKWLCQKAVDDSEGRKFWINAYICDYRLWDIAHKLKGLINKRVMTIKMFLERDNLNFWLDISKDGGFNSIDDIELICDEVWHQLNCDYYD